MKYCYHHADADGNASAFAVKRKFPGEFIRFVPSFYDMKADFIAITAADEVYVVDFSFKPDVFRSLVATGAKITWIDHHKTILEPEYDEFHTLDGIRFDGAAACFLTWKFLFPDEEVPRAIQLIADYDVWKFEFGNDTRYFMAFMDSVDTYPLSQFWKDLFAVRHYMNNAIRDGRVIFDFQERQNYRNVKALGYEVDFFGEHCLVVNGYGSSQMFKNVDPKRFTLYVMWQWKNSHYNVSLRAPDGSTVDCAAIAQQFGGGGHKGASGFDCDELPWKGRPETKYRENRDAATSGA